MKKTNIEDIHKGDYIKAVRKEKDNSSETWNITYFKVESRRINYLFSSRFIDFHDKNKFLKIIDIKNGCEDSSKSYFYKLSEEEFLKQFGKMLILHNLEN